MKEVDKVIHELISEYESNVGFKSVPFTVRFAHKDNRRLEFISKKLGKSRQELLTTLALAALMDVELKLGFAERTDKGVEYSSFYKGIVSGNDPIEDHFPEEEVSEEKSKAKRSSIRKTPPGRLF